MKRAKWLVVLVVVALALVAGTAVALAQNEVPPPYAGAHNPFSWDDTQAQAAGAAVFKKSCIGCHGPAGDGISKADFTTRALTDDLEAEPDFYFYVVSEGRMSNGMPGFKGSLSEEQRWQVLTYIHTLSSVVPTTEPTATATPTPTITPVAPGTTMQLSIPDRSLSGAPLQLIAALKDPADQPIPDATISFSYDVTFFAQGTFTIGDAVTDARGIAQVEFVPNQQGPITINVVYQDLHQSVSVELLPSSSSYRVDIGVHLPQIGGGQVNYGPPSSMGFDQNDSALNSALRLPGGIPSWLLLFIGVIAVIWFTYFRVVYQLFRISPGRGDDMEEGRSNTRLVPILIMLFVFTVGIVLLLMIATGPNSQLHAM
jgi:mono/diheme cytochrome c family protein